MTDYLSKNVLITICIFGVIVIVVFAGRCHKSKEDPRIKELKNEIAFRELHIHKLQKNQAIYDSAIKKADKEREQHRKESAQIKAERDFYKAKLRTAKDCKDSVITLVTIDQKSDSLIASQATQIKADSSAISARDKAMDGLDSINTNLQIEIGQIKQINEMQLRDYFAHGREEFWKGFKTAGIIGGILAILALIL